MSEQKVIKRRGVFFIVKLTLWVCSRRAHPVKRDLVRRVNVKLLDYADSNKLYRHGAGVKLMLNHVVIACVQ